MTDKAPPSGHRILPLATLATLGKANLEPQIRRTSDFRPGRDLEAALHQSLTAGKALMLLGTKHGTLYLQPRSHDATSQPDTRDRNEGLPTHPAHGDAEPILLVELHHRNLLEQFPVLANAPTVSFRTDRGAGSFLQTYADLVEKGMAQHSSTQTRERLTRHLGEIVVTTMLDALHLETSVAGRRRHRQKIVRDYIETRLSNADLTPQTIARAYGISARALYLLFDGEPGAVSGWILHRRLERIHADLIDPAHAHEAIATISARHGFRNAAHLSRRFRQKFGVSPREARQSAQKHPA